MKMFNEPLALATLGNTDVSNAGRATHSRQASSCDDESPWMCFINHAVRVNKTSMEAPEGSQPAAEMTSEVKSYTSLSGWLILSERVELRYSFFLLSNLWYGENCFLLLLLLLHGCLAIPMMSRDLVTSSCQAAKAWATWRAPSDCCRKGELHRSAGVVCTMSVSVLPWRRRNNLVGSWMCRCGSFSRSSPRPSFLQRRHMRGNMSSESGRVSGDVSRE